MDKYYHSIQDWNRFADAVTDLITDYIKYSSWIDGNDGIYVDENDNVSLENGNEITDKDNFYPIMNLLMIEDGKHDVDYDKIQELTDKYIFVR